MFLKVTLRLARPKAAPVTRGFLVDGYFTIEDYKTNIVLVGVTNA